jgi:hypothetical protein
MSNPVEGMDIKAVRKWHSESPSRVEVYGLLVRIANANVHLANCATHIVAEETQQALEEVKKALGFLSAFEGDMPVIDPKVVEELKTNIERDNG